MDWRVRGEVPADEYLVPLGVADVKRAGEDVTLVGTSSMVRACLEAAELLAADGISAEVVDPRTLSPLDVDALIRSAAKTGRAIVVDEGHRSYGVSAEIASVIAEGAFYELDAPVRRLGAMDVPVPFSPTLEDETVPTPDTVAATARELCGRR
jgi:pyruvate dehydrogenase E1 component beta subunit